MSAAGPYSDRRLPGSLIAIADVRAGPRDGNWAATGQAATSPRDVGIGHLPARANCSPNITFAEHFAKIRAELCATVTQGAQPSRKGRNRHARGATVT
jgi:hypothetical protein